MFNIFLQFNLLGQFIHIPIHDHTNVTISLRPFKHFGMLALTPADHRSQQLNSGTFRHLHNLIHHLVNTLFMNLLTTIRAMRNTDSCIEKPEIIINFCHSSNCGTRISIGRLLINGNSRRKSLDFLHVRFLHLSQKHPCIRGQRFHIPPLALCVYGIECQGTLAGTRQSGEYHQFISGNIHIDIFQVVLICSPNLDVFLSGTHFLNVFHHFLSFCRALFSGSLLF